MLSASRLLPLAAVFAALAGPATSQAADGCDPPAARRLLEAPAGAAQVVPGEFVVRYRNAAGAERGTRRLAAAGADGRRVGGRVAVVRLPKGKALRGAAAALRNDPDIAWVEPNYIYTATGAPTPDDPLFAQQWSMQNDGTSTSGGPAKDDADIDAPEAWGSTTGSASVLVAVVDTGADLGHPDLAPNIAVNPGESGNGREANGVDDDNNGLVDDVRGWDFANVDNDPFDTFGHGTHVTGTIGARGGDGTGVAGVAWQVGLLPLRALNDEGWGSSLDIATAMTYAASRGARVVNISLGGAGYSNAMREAICAAPETLFVVAAGNDGRNVDGQPFYPCSYTAPNVLCVGATTPADTLAAFSNRGAGAVDLAAPGVGIVSSVPGGTAYYSGTSMATPHVSGAAALVWTMHPDWTVAQVREAILAGVDRLPALEGQVASGGRLNVAGALAVAGVRAPAVTTGAVTAIAAASATLNGTVDSAGRSARYRFDFGTTPAYGTTTEPLAVPEAGGAAAVAAPLAGLTPGTTYHARVVLMTADGEVAGNDVTFATPGALLAATGAAVPAGRASARLTGTVDGGGAAVTYHFEFGTTTAYGRRTVARRVGASAGRSPVEGVAGSLRPGAKIHYRLVVTGPGGAIAQGADRTITIGRASLHVRRARAVGRTVLVTVRVPGAGRVTATVAGTLRNGQSARGRLTVFARRGGTKILRVRLYAAGDHPQALATGRIRVTVTFTPTRSRAAAGRTVQLTAPKPR